MAKSFKFVIFAFALMLQVCAIAGSKESKPWSKYCTLTGIPAKPHGIDKFDRLMQDFVRECEPAQACVLSCMRNHCAMGGGGCFHDCGPSDYGPPEVLADMYAAKDKRVCPQP